MIFAKNNSRLPRLRGTAVWRLCELYIPLQGRMPTSARKVCATFGGRRKLPQSALRAASSLKEGAFLDRTNHK